MVVGWIVVVAAVVIVLVVMAKSQDAVYFSQIIKRYLFYIFFIAVVAFFVFSFYRINLANDFDYSSYEGVVQAGQVYLLWLKGLAGNVVEVTGYAVKQDWIGSNSTVER
ncbi:MAG: hypothetical protein AABW80_00980 [Nanoarchaeota archaeon]